MTDKPATSSNHSKIYIVLIVLILILLGVVVKLYNTTETKEVVIEDLTSEKLELANEFQQLALDYDSIKTSNETATGLLSVERERIAQLLEEMKTMKSANAEQLNAYKKELVSLRNIMRNFVIQIDSLNNRNKILAKENTEVQKSFVTMQDSYKVLEEEKKGLATKIEIASRLEARDIVITALTSKGKETTKVNRTEKIKVCFTLLKNLTASVGEKNIFLRLVRPDEELLFKSNDNQFKYEGTMITYSATRLIEYGGADLEVCLFYDADEGELMEGIYTADLFTDGFNLANVKFELK